MTSRAAATRYARALFDVVLKEGGDAAAERAQQEVRDFADLVKSSDALTHVLSNPAIAASRKRAVVEALLDRAGGISTPVRKLLMLLAERDRLVLLPDLADAYAGRLMDHQKVIRGEVTSAVPLDDEQVRALEQGLARATGRRVILLPRTDPSILGGAITRLGSMVYDGSVTTQLQRMKETLIESAQ